MEEFEDAEELKWHFHKKLCEGDYSAEYTIKCIMREDLRTDPAKLNKWLKRMRLPYKVKEK